MTKQSPADSSAARGDSNRGAQLKGNAPPPESGGAISSIAPAAQDEPDAASGSGGGTGNGNDNGPRTGFADPADGRPPRRVKGMLGPGTDDEFGVFDDYEPAGRRSRIDDFDSSDAKSLLDGDVTAETSRGIARSVKSALKRGTRRDNLPSRRYHGGHRHGTGWGKAEFPPGWGEAEVMDWVRALIDNPSGVRRAPRRTGFVIAGSYKGISGEVIVRPAGENSWYIATAYPNS